MGGLQSHEPVDDPAESSDTDYRGSLRMLTGMLTRQHAAKKHRGKLLFLGLDGAGKSTLANHLSRLSVGDDLTLYTSKGLELPSYLYPEPTRTLQTATFRVENSERYLQLVDPPGRRTFRAKWYSATGDSSTFSGSSNNLNNLAPAAVANTFQTPLPILAVLFIVDAADPVRFPLVAAELVRFLKHKASHKAFVHAPLLLVFNKTDHFLPPLPVETPEEPQSKEYQLLLNNRKQQQRSALREARRELRKCVDYELIMDRRRHPAPKASAAASSAASSKSKAYTPSLLFAAPVGAVADVGAPTGPARRNSNASATATAANPLAGSAVFTNVVECCAQDRDSVRALRGWLNDELKKAPLS
jgi:GTPase SAR1 family protein